MSNILRRPNFEQIEDQYTREGMQYLWEYLQAESLLQGNFEFLELNFGAAVTNEKIPHSLGFTPTDIIVTRSTGAGSVTFNYDSFDSDNLDITISGGAASVRFFAGRYEEAQ